MTSNPFHRSLDEQFRGRKVRATSNDGVVFTGWVDRVHHHDRHVVLLDATNHARGEKVGTVLVSHADTIETLPEDGRIERVDLEDVQPSPYHRREFEESANRGYVADVRDSGFVGSYPVIRETPEGPEVVEGHKRIWACRQAGMNTHPVRIVDIDDWTATRRFVVDHLPDPGQVNQNGTASGCYAGDQLREVIHAIVDDWGDRARELDRLMYNANRLDLDVPWRDTDDKETVSSRGNRDLDFDDLDTCVEPAPADERDDDGSVLARSEVKSYGLFFPSAVVNHFDTDRVTVRRRNERVELAPGASDEWPDYALGDHDVNIGQPGLDVINATEGDELTAIADGDVAIITVDDEDIEDSELATETDHDQSDDATHEANASLQERLVNVLEEHGELPSKDIELLLETTSDHYRNVLSQLQRAGRVKSRQDPEDRRRNLYRLADDDPADTSADDQDPDRDTDDSQSTDNPGDLDWDVPDEIQADAVEDTDADRVEFTDYGADPGNGTECQNCGAHLDKKFGKVFEPESEGAPRCCPNCTDLVRDGNEIREARAPAGRGTQS